MCQGQRGGFLFCRHPQLAKGLDLNSPNFINICIHTYKLKKETCHCAQMQPLHSLPVYNPCIFFSVTFISIQVRHFSWAWPCTGKLLLMKEVFCSSGSMEEERAFQHPVMKKLWSQFYVLCHYIMASKQNHQMNVGTHLMSMG